MGLAGLKPATSALRVHADRCRGVLKRLDSCLKFTV